MYFLFSYSRFMRAIKAIETKSEDADYMASCLIEVEALMELDHPNVVKLYEFYGGTCESSTLYLVEELCTGGTLESKIHDAGGRLSSDMTAVYLRQMLVRSPAHHACPPRLPTTPAHHAQSNMMARAAHPITSVAHPQLRPAGLFSAVDAARRAVLPCPWTRPPRP